MKNIFYFKRISAIGGTEQFLFEIAKKYNDYDITIFFDEADLFQLERLKKFVRCKKRVAGEKIKCERAFLNFNADIINDIESDEIYFVSHANYEELNRVNGGYIPPIDNIKINHYIGVSQFATDKLNEYAEKIDTKIRAKRCYNPLTLEPKEKVIHIVSAGRIDDKVKGGWRILKLIKALDKYCSNTGRHYIWTIFTNPIQEKINSPNVAVMKPRVDVRAYIADADYVVQLSNDMETYCYTINEALGYGVPIITTPLSILNELPITDNDHLVVEYDCSNVDDIARQIFEKKVKSFNYKPPVDNWEEYLIKGKSTYKEELKMKYLVEALPIYKERNITDNFLQRVPYEKEQWIVSKERLEQLLGDNEHNEVFVKVIKEINDEDTEQTTDNTETKADEDTEQTTDNTETKTDEDTEQTTDNTETETDEDNINNNEEALKTNESKEEKPKNPKGKK